MRRLLYRQALAIDNGDAKNKRMQLIKKNCWEFKNCGRQEGGERARDLGVCPVAVEKRLNGINGGTNAGRSCWVVVAAACEEKWDTLAEKLNSCIECDFYNKVREEEGAKFVLASVLLQKIGEMVDDEASYLEGHPRKFKQKRREESHALILKAIGEVLNNSNSKR